MLYNKSMIKKNVLESIDGGYILQLAEFSDEKTKLRSEGISPELLKHAQMIVDKDFKEIIISHPKEKQIKLACLQYFFAIYLLNQINVKNKVGYKANLKKLVTQHNQVKDLLDDLQNFDFYIGGCGMEAQNLCQK